MTRALGRIFGGSFVVLCLALVVVGVSWAFASCEANPPREGPILSPHAHAGLGHGDECEFCRFREPNRAKGVEK